MLAEIAVEQFADCLDAVALEVLEEARLDRPPVDAFALARALEITVALDDHQRGRARYVRLKGHRGPNARSTIMLRPEPRCERRHWAVAHEIGEHVACRVFAALGVDPRETDTGAREAVANQMAGRLLLPTDWFAREAAESGWDLVALKRRFQTASHELIARRMLEFPTPVIISIFDHCRLTFRRGNLPGRVPPPSPIELQCRQSAHQTVRPHRQDADQYSVQAWPIHEDGWPREILRTELADSE